MKPLHHGRSRISAVTILVGIVMLLVPALAWMQYQWLGQLSTAERERMQRTLRTAAAQFATEFDGELSRTLVSLQVDGQTVRDQNWAKYAQQYSRWMSSTTEPRLIRDIWVVDTRPGTVLPTFDTGGPVPVENLRLRKWNTQSLAFEDTQWPADLAKARDSLAGRFIGLQMNGGNSIAKAMDDRRRPQGGPEHRDAALSLSVDDENTLISPATLFEVAAHPGTPKISIIGFTILRLDPAIIRDTILASLAARHFHGDDTEADYRVAVVQRDDPAQVVWESEPGVATLIAAAPDVTQGFMGPRPDQVFVFARNLTNDTAQVRAMALPPPPPPPPPPPGAASGEPGGGTNKVIVSMLEREERAGPGGRGGRVITRAGNFGVSEGRWVLMAKHRSGSLEAAVASVRMRNLGISSGILLLLTLAVGLIVVSARRAQNLARQQMEFVAAVSHELRTPVSVIGTAAGNLADGVVGDPQRVRKYGETIQGEARRLGETVERVLQLAGIAAGRAAAARTPVRPEDLIHESLEGCRIEIEKAGINVDVSIADNLPNVVGDVTALKSALQNLISNAVKYGGTERWMRVSATLDPGIGTKQQVILSVEDHGIGIDAEDREHIFEPFYRGREAVSQQIQGSGLGLNLVQRIAEAHDGKVTVTSEPGKGSVFALALPAVHDRSASARQHSGELPRDLAEAASGSEGGAPKTETLNLARQASPSR